MIEYKLRCFLLHILAHDYHLLEILGVLVNDLADLLVLLLDQLGLLLRHEDLAELLILRFYIRLLGFIGLG